MRILSQARRWTRILALALVLLLGTWLFVLFRSSQRLRASLREQEIQSKRASGSALSERTRNTNIVQEPLRKDLSNIGEAQDAKLNLKDLVTTAGRDKREGSYIPPEHHMSASLEGDVLGQVHIFYYSWWGSPEGTIETGYAHWNHAVLPHWQASVNENYKGVIGKVYQPPNEVGANFYPASGPYSSSNQATIERHAREIKASGATVVVLSWYPPGKSDSNGLPELADQLTSRLLDAFGRQGLKLAFHIEPYTGRTATSVWNDAEYISLRYGAHPALAKVKGKPLLYIYDSYLIPSEQWRETAVEKGMRQHKNACYLGLVVESRHINDIAASDGFFDGVFTYFAADGFVWGSTRSSWKELVSMSKQQGLLTSISVGPGYIDTKIRPWNGVNTRSRDAGMYYRQSFQAAAVANPDFISITSYNEWHEGTQIEPAVEKEGYENYKDAANALNFGDEPSVYLELTARLVNEYFGARTSTK